MNPKITVLIVEDEPLLLEAIEKKLTSRGFAAVGFEGAEKALEFLRNTPKLPDVIWLDYYLKDMNGMDFMKHLNSEVKFANLPVIVVSNSASPQKVSGMMDLGAKMYVLKADNKLDDIIEDINSLVEKK